VVGSGDGGQPAQPDSAKPGINPVREDDTRVTGTGVPGATIEVTFPGGTTVTTTVNSDGTWAVNVPGTVDLKDGDEISAVQTETGKKPSAPETVLVLEDTESEPPVVNPVDEDDDKITGEGVPGSEIEVTFPDGTTVTTIVDEDGNWEVDIPDDVDLKDGDTIEVVQTEPGKDPSDPATEVVVGSGDGGGNDGGGNDGNGNGGGGNDGNGNDGGGNNGDGGGQQPEPSRSAAPGINPVRVGDEWVTGVGVPGATVTVTFPNGATVTVGVGSDGTWQVRVPSGVNLKNDDIVKAVQTEPGKNPSGPTSTLVIGSNESEPPVVNPIGEDDDKITGEGTPGAEITVTFPDGTTETATVGDDGKWEVDIPDDMDLKDGDVIEVVQTEPGKGPSDPATEVVVGSGEGGRQPMPDESTAPRINPVRAGDGYVTGTGTPGATVTVTFPNGATVTVGVGSDGTWQVRVPSGVNLKNNDVIKAVQTEPGKSTSNPATAIVTSNGSGGGTGVVNAGGGGGGGNNNGGSGSNNNGNSGNSGNGSNTGGSSDTGSTGSSDTGGTGDSNTGNTGDSTGDGEIIIGGGGGGGNGGNGGGGGNGGYSPPPRGPIDTSSFDSNNPPRYLESIDPSFIPQGWVQVHKTDPDTGDEYWTLEPDMVALGVMVPKTGGNPNIVSFSLMCLLVLCFVGSCLIIEKKSYKGRHTYQDKHCRA
jgi:hypothetical protein